MAPICTKLPVAADAEKSPQTKYCCALRPVPPTFTVTLCQFEPATGKMLASDGVTVPVAGEAVNAVHEATVLGSKRTARKLTPGFNA